jgi:hypothetical protein
MDDVSLWARKVVGKRKGGADMTQREKDHDKDFKGLSIGPVVAENDDPYFGRSHWQ